MNVSSVQGTEIFAYSVTGYCDSSLTMTLLANPTSPKSVTLCTYLLTVTPCPGPDGVTVSQYLRIIMSLNFDPNIYDLLVVIPSCVYDTEMGPPQCIFV